jgi:hypothetical protein
MPLVLESQKQSRAWAETKAKEHRVVSEGDDIGIIMNSSTDDKDEEMLQQRFQDRSRFDRDGMPDVPVEEPSTSLEDVVPPPPTKPRNMV